MGIADFRLGELEQACIGGCGAWGPSGGPALRRASDGTAATIATSRTIDGAFRQVARQWVATLFSMVSPRTWDCGSAADAHPRFRGLGASFSNPKSEISMAAHLAAVPYCNTSRIAAGSLFPIWRGHTITKKRRQEILSAAETPWSAHPGAEEHESYRE